MEVKKEVKRDNSFTRAEQSSSQLAGFNFLHEVLNSLFNFIL